MKRFYLPFVLSYLLFIGHHGFSQDFDGLIPKEAKSNGKLGVLVRSLASDKKILEHNSDKLFVPASNQKVITSVTALSLLGSDYRFRTEFYSGGGIADGVLYGGLYIKGYGDPTITTEHLNSIVYELKKRGVKEIKGGITVDDSYFDMVRYAKGWKEEWRGDFYSPPIGALTLNHNIFEIKVYPSKSGRIPTVELEPRGTNINIINKAITSTKRGGLSAKWLEDGKTIMLQGRISPRSSFYSFKIPIGSPDLYTGSALRGVLVDAGIKVNGFLARGEVPHWAKIFYTHFSDPLHSIITEYNKNSVNIIGENILKTLGAEFKAAPGTWEKGAQVVSEFLHKIGIKDEFRIVDGSGLSLLNQITPHAIIEVLKYAYKNQLIGFQFLSSLPIAGVDGTLKHRFSTSDVKGRVFAKTGYLNNVRSLSGYVFTKSGDVLVFSILANGLGWKAKEFQNDLLVLLVECCKTNGSKSNGVPKRNP
jgi:D-alanyl-D-alanine carboxypeptidase/D-alanyl-D-alanine-endopeptidase (penicillin-binding protein 4)